MSFMEQVTPIVDETIRAKTGADCALDDASGGLDGGLVGVEQFKLVMPPIAFAVVQGIYKGLRRSNRYVH